MSKAVAVFYSQDNAVQAVKTLRQEGYARDEIVVLGKNRDSVRFVESDTDVHADELQDLSETRRTDRTAIDDVGFAAAAIPFGGGTIASGAAAFFAGGYTVADEMLGGDTPYEIMINDLGLEGSVGARCRDAVSQGLIIVIADRKDGNDSVYGADSSSKDAVTAAEHIFRACGAEEVL